MNISQLLESANKPAFQVKQYADKLIKKWEPTGLLEGKDIDKSRYGKERMAMILEQQAKQLVVESSMTGTGATFTVGQGEQWAGVALPLVRKVFADISAKEFLSVQPMSLPSGLVFYLEFRYGSNQPFGAPRFNIGDSLFGITSTKNVDPRGGLYGAGRFGYSINEYSASVGYLSAAATFGDVNYNSRYSASIAASQMIKLTVQSASVSVPNLDTLGVRAFVITGSGGIGESTVFAEFTSYNPTLDQLTFVASASNAVGSGSAAIWYQIQTKDNNRGDFEDRDTRPITGSAAIPELNMDMRSEAIVAKTRKLKAKWTPEFSQDLDAYQSLDAEAEITSIMSEYIAMEIDLELLDMIVGSVNTTAVWSARSNRFFDRATGTFFDAAAGAGGYYNTQGGWFQTLGTKVQDVANTIWTKTLRGQANVMMISPKVSNIITSIPGYASDSAGDKMDTYSFGTQKLGALNSRQKVYVNSYMQDNIILLAYKGGAFLETGAAFCPYVPLIMTPLVYDPETFTPRKGLLTRYAKKMIRPEYFGAIYVADLDTI